MLIQEMTGQACLDMLARAHLCRLACAQSGQPYVVPSYFAYHNNFLYSFATVGQKIEWMRADPRVCVEADEIVNQENWSSVIVFGQYEELLTIPEYEAERAVAYRVLQEKAMWWEPRLRENDLARCRTPAGTRFFPYSNRSNYRSSRDALRRLMPQQD